MKIGEIEALRQWASNPFADNLKMRTQVVAALDYLAEVERERDEAVQRLNDMRLWAGKVQMEAQDLHERSKAQLATLRAAVDEAVSELENLDETFDYAAFCRALDTLRNLTKPDTPSERIMSDKDRENPVEGAHPTKPEGEGKAYPDVCPVCSGDCAGANPPVIFCPMQDHKPTQPEGEDALVEETYAKLKRAWLAADYAEAADFVDEDNAAKAILSEALAAARGGRVVFDGRGW